MELAEIVESAGALADIRRNVDKDSKAVAQLATALFYLQAANVFKPGSAIRETLEARYDEYIKEFDGEKAYSAYRQSL
jgi:hypothetical protein